MRLWRRWSAWLALSVLLWAVAAESTHHHSSQTEAAACSICVVASTASPAVSCGHGVTVFAAVGLLKIEDVAVPARFDFSDQGIRGPPIVL